jgi:hypothetical protein
MHTHHLSQLSRRRRAGLAAMFNQAIGSSLSILDQSSSRTQWFFIDTINSAQSLVRPQRDSTMV